MVNIEHMRRKISERAQIVNDLPDLTPQQSEFVRHILEGKSGADAYRAAYDCSKSGNNTVWVDASRLRNNPNVALWLAAARKAEVGHAQITLNQHIQRLDALKQRCEEHGNFGAAVQAEQLIGKAMGHYTEKLDITVTDIADELRELDKISPELARAYANEKGITWQ